MNIKDIMSRHDLSVDSFKELKSGYSGARKFTLYSETNKPLYLLKVYDIGKKDRVKQQFELLKKHYENSVLCHQPIIFESNEEVQACYLVLTYIDGMSGEAALPTLRTDLQYKIGVQAGKELRKIHLITRDNSFDWYKNRVEKYFNKIKTCKKYGLIFHKQRFMENYIDENISILKNSPVCFQHDDFHPQNIIIDDNELNGIIDFDSFDWGDPLEDFFKLPKYTIQVSAHFAKGQIMGYFDDKIPDLFWRKYNLFVALNLHASQIGGYTMGNLEYVQERTRYMIETHDFIDHNAPEWFDDCQL